MEQVSEGLLFSLKEVTFEPEIPRANEMFSVKGKVDLFKLSFLAPLWVIITCRYPETFWQEILPLIGATQERKTGTVMGGDFEVIFPEGVKREGDFEVTIGIYSGPVTTAILNWTLPPFPPITSQEVVLRVSGKVAPKELAWEMVEEVSPIMIYPPTATPAGWELIQEVSPIMIYLAPMSTPTPPSPPAPGPSLVPEVRNLRVLSNTSKPWLGGTCYVYLIFDYKGPEITRTFYASLGRVRTIVGIESFDEILRGWQSKVILEATGDWETRLAKVLIPIPTEQKYLGFYDLYAKVDSVLTPTLRGVVEITT